ncbi:LPXTG cell wall anchor domain-containing protein [Catelliglobosispora koreensis]|nr:LPXTG cell wall anchor domain-containing protein [Catelliglobosispora koreensis]
MPTTGSRLLPSLLTAGTILVILGGAMLIVLRRTRKS